MPQDPEATRSKKDAQNALLPRTLFGDQVKRGDTITMKVSAVFGDEVEVAATSVSGEDDELEQEPMLQQPTADAEIEAAAQPLNPNANTNSAVG